MESMSDSDMGLQVDLFVYIVDFYVPVGDSFFLSV